MKEKPTLELHCAFDECPGPPHWTTPMGNVVCDVHRGWVDHYYATAAPETKCQAMKREPKEVK